jgi:hypothetical protein
LKVVADDVSLKNTGSVCACAEEMQTAASAAMVDLKMDILAKFLLMER